MNVRSVVALALAASSALAGAHMPYVLPSLFDAGGRDRVTLQASFTEDAFRPEVAMQDAPFEITGPDGRTLSLPAPSLTHDLTVTEATLPVDGVYRLSSGQRLGRMGKMYRAGEAWVMVGEGAAPPPGSTLVDVRSTTLADAYVLRGKPTRPAALTPRGKGLELQPLGDPTAYSPAAVTRFTVLFNGAPLPGTGVTLFREAGFYDGRKQVAEVRSDAKGEVALTPPDAGRYLLMVRHRDGSPPAPGATRLSYTTTLAFEVM